MYAGGKHQTRSVNQMQVLLTLPGTQGQFSISRIVEDQASTMKMSDFSIETLAIDEVLQNAHYSGVIIEVSDLEGYEGSLRFIEKSVYPDKVPFIYISRAELDLATVSRFFPDQMLLSPFSEETLRNTIHLFLQKINQGYFNNINKSRPQKRLWLLLKRGVYISLEVDEIKYIEAEDHYIKIHSEKQSLPLIKASLSGFYGKHLKVFGHFYALSRSCVVNTNKIRKIENNQLYIDPNKPLSIPKGKRDEVLEFIGV